MESDLPSSFTNYQLEGPSDAALKNLIFNEPRIAVSKLRDLDETNSKLERFEFLYLLIGILSPDRSDELPPMCWNSLLDAGLPQLLIEIFSKELKNAERVSNIRLHSLPLFLLLIPSRVKHTPTLPVRSRQHLSVSKQLRSEIVRRVCRYLLIGPIPLWRLYGRIVNTSQQMRQHGQSKGVSGFKINISCQKVFLSLK